MSERTALYRLFDADGALLYVGVTKNFGRRWEHHACMQAWWPLVQRQTVEWHPDRDLAHAAEIEAIQAERPKFNQVHVPKSVEREPLPIRLGRGPMGPSDLLSTSDAARMTSPPTTRFTVEREIDRGNLAAEKFGDRWLIEIPEAARWAASYVRYREQRERRRG